MRWVGGRVGFWMVRLALLALGSGASLAVLEFAILRGIYGYHGMADPTELFQHDERLGWKFKPRAKAVHAQIEFSVPYEVNGKGLRDIELGYERTPGTFRILVLGDSMTEGYGVELEKTYVKQLEKSLNTGAPTVVEVINAGVRGYSTDQEFLFLVDEGVKYRADLVIVGFCGGDENNTEIAGFMGARLYYKPFFRLQGNELILDGVPVPAADAEREREDRWERLKRKVRWSASYAWTSWHVRQARVRPLLERVGVVKRAAAVATQADVGAPRFGAEVWRIERRIFREMKRVTEDHGGHLLIALISGERPYADALASLSRDLGISYLDVANHPALRAVDDEPVRFGTTATITPVVIRPLPGS